jgi:hypothetical protein
MNKSASEVEIMKVEEPRATYTATNKNGFSLLITIPFSATESDIQKLFDNLDIADNLLAVNGYQVQTTKSYGGGSKPAYTPKEKKYTGELCPNDGGRLYTETTKNGKTFTACENRKYDFTTKQTTGCNYIVWEKSY